MALSAWRIGVEIVAFVLMSNHFHMLIVCRERKQTYSFLKLFKQLLSTYQRNKYSAQKIMHHSADSISLIDSIQYLRNCIAYIFRNPVSAKICPKLEDYRWSSYSSSLFSSSDVALNMKVRELTIRQKRRILHTGMSLTSCPLDIDAEGYIVLESFVTYEIIGYAFRNSGKSFLYYLGSCNDARMEYELIYQPLMNVTDTDMLDAVAKFVASRFRNKSISELTTSEKCSILKSLFFNHKTTIPQLARILGLSRELVRKILSQ